MSEHFYAVIMAGGGGTRLWPFSRKARPKQMLHLFGERTLFQIAVDRLQGMFPPERILVVTVADQALALQKEYPQIPVENFLIEPKPRGTASVVGMAAWALSQRDPQACMAVLTADHYMENVPLFQKLLSAAEKVAQEGCLVTLGIKPIFASTGYGYIQRGEAAGTYEGLPAYRVLKFKEKPLQELAAEFIARGDHDWNSGMFIWNTDTIREEISRQMPALAETLDAIGAELGRASASPRSAALWEAIRPQTVDYGIMENARKVAVLPAENLGWNDVGSWDSLFDVVQPDQDGNIILGSHFQGVASSGCLVCSEHPERLVALIGLKDMIIIDSSDALLICSRKDAQRVREVVKHLTDNGYQLYL